jgi:hypothetical protein
MTQDSGQAVERGAAEEASGAPLTETEAELSERPAGQPDPERLVSEDDGSGMAGGASGGTGGTSGMSEQPDAG